MAVEKIVTASGVTLFHAAGVILEMVPDFGDLAYDWTALLAEGVEPATYLVDCYRPIDLKPELLAEAASLATEHGLRMVHPTEAQATAFERAYSRLLPY